MSTGSRRRMTLAVLAMVVAGCAPDTSTTTTTLATSTTTVAPTTTTTTSPNTTTTAPATTTTTDGGGPVTVLLSPFSEMGPAWTEQVFLYGETGETLGTSPGGENLLFGPEYGTQTPDGTWWFLDGAKQRIAHFDAEGGYLDQVIMPEDLLVDGIYFQYQMPQALDDGSVVASGWREGETTSLLRIMDGAASGVTFEGAIPWVTTDGSHLYGQTVEGSAPRRLDPDNPVAEPTDWFMTRGGSRYMITLDEDEILVELPDADQAGPRTLQMRYSEDPEVIARGAIEVESGADGTLFILLYGVPMSDEILDIGALISISPDGAVSEAEQIVSPFSSSDPGSPARLGVTPGTSTPWLMVVGEDGVHVHSRTG